MEKKFLCVIPNDLVRTKKNLRRVNFLNYVLFFFPYLLGIFKMFLMLAKIVNCIVLK
jgi:hypothetical protein